MEGDALLINIVGFDLYKLIIITIQDIQNADLFTIIRIDFTRININLDFNRLQGRNSDFTAVRIQDFGNVFNFHFGTQFRTIRDLNRR